MIYPNNPPPHGGSDGYVWSSDSSLIALHFLKFLSYSQACLILPCCYNMLQFFPVHDGAKNVYCLSFADVCDKDFVSYLFQFQIVS